MEYKKQDLNSSKYRRSFGVHLTSRDTFLKYIFPEIKERLWEYTWIDLYAGEGNLILPILNSIPNENRIEFFKEHIFLFDIQPEMVQKSIINAEKHGIPSEVASNNIQLRDNLESFPTYLNTAQFPLFHITNPPYLYLGYIRKHKETQKYLPLFQGKNDGYQDLYQIAMINDLRYKIENLVYIIPTNFLYGASVSNKFRIDFLKDYEILKMVILETQIFEFTGTNICIGFFKRKTVSKNEIQSFTSLKVKKKNRILNRENKLIPKYKYRAGSEFEEFLEQNRSRNPLKVSYYLRNEDVLENFGPFRITVIDANKYKNNQYKRLTISINGKLREKIEKNVLYVRTVDTGSIAGRAGLGIIEEEFGVKGIYVTSNTYRTHPIQIFLKPELSFEDQLLLRNFVNLILEFYRDKLDSEFLTTYKYSDADYTRKYLGLTQVKGLIEIFPHNVDEEKKRKLVSLIKVNDPYALIKFIEMNKG
jgi:methylase of polypeptide subunit release factors